MLRSDLDSDTPGVFATVTADASFTDDGVRPGRRYVYRVVAVNDDGDSPNSDPITVDTPAQPEPDTTEPESGSEPELLELPEPTLVEVGEPPLIPSLQLQGQTPTEFVVTTEVTSNAITGPYQQPALHDTIWSATLTVGESAEGMNFVRGYASSYGGLSDTTFEYRGTQRDVVALASLFRSGESRFMRLEIVASDISSGLDPGVVLSVAGTQFAFDSASSVSHSTANIGGTEKATVIYTWNPTNLHLRGGANLAVSLSAPVIVGPDGIPVSGRLVASAASEPEDAGWVSHTYPTACRKLFPDHAPGRMRLGSSYLGCARDLESQWFVVDLQQHRNYEIEILTDAGARLVPDLNHAHHPADPTYRFIWGGRRYEQCERVRVEGRNRTYCRWGRDWLRVYTQRGGEHLIKVANGSHGITNPDYRIRVREQ